MKTSLTEAEVNEIVDRLLVSTDWQAFWDKVAEDSAKEIDAYANARVESLRLAGGIVFD